MRKFLIVLLAATLLLVAAACGGTDTPLGNELPTEIRVVGVDVNGDLSTIYNPADPAATFPPENIISTNPEDTVGLDVNGEFSTVYDPSQPGATFPPNNVYVTPKPPQASNAPSATPVPITLGTPTPPPNTTPTPAPTPTPEPFEGGTEGGDDFDKGATVVDFGDLIGNP